MDSEEINREGVAQTVSHRFIETNGINMHIAEQGSGPLVLFCHGFPEFWHTWNRQMAALAAAGYHAVAPDQRGYGQTDRPEAIEAYTQLHLVGDMVGLLDALGEEQAVIVGHDWGANVAWHAALMRPDRFPAVAVLSVPYIARGPITGPRATPRPTDAMRKLVGDQFYYQLYFQKPGLAEAELEHDVSVTMQRFYYGLSGDTPPAERWHPILPSSHRRIFDTMSNADTLPPWLRQDEFDLAVEAFQHSGFRGGLNWYRNYDRNWELLAAYSRAKISQPALFLWGDQDPTFELAGSIKRIERMPELLPLVRTQKLAGAGHWLQQERSEEVNAALLEFLGDI